MNKRNRGDRRGTVTQISQYLDPGCMTKEQWVDFVEKNGYVPTWRPTHSRQLARSHAS